MADLTTFDAALHIWYEGAIEQQLNVETNIVDLSTKDIQPWGGKSISVPLELGHGEASTLQDGGALPAFTGVDLGELSITSGALVKRFQISGESMAAAPSGATHAAEPIFDVEMRGVVKGMKTTSNRLFLWGGRCKGWCNERKAMAGAGGLTTAAATVAAPAAGTDIFEFTGDLNVGVNGPFSGVPNNATLVAGASAAWVRVRIFRNDTYAELLATPAGAGTAAGTAIFVSAIDTVNHRIRLAVVSDGIGSTLDTSGIADGEGFTVALHNQVHILVGGADAGLPFGTIVAFSKEPVGICGNLSDITHFGLDRGDASAITGASEVQSSILVANPVAPAARTPLTFPMLQEALDVITDRTDGQPTHLIMHSSQRQRYIALGQVVNTLKTDGSKGSSLDGGFGDRVSYNGLPFLVSRHMGRGGIIFYDKANWKMYERSKAGFRSGKGGAILEHLENSDNVQGVYIWRYQFVCGRPGANAVLVGLDI